MRFLLSREILLGVSKARESEKRAHEVVLSGVPESVTDSPTSRAQEDRNKVLKVMDTCEAEFLPITTYRMGRLQPDGRPRLLKIQLPTNQAAISMLRNRNKLSLNSETKNYFLRASQSQEEREAYRALAKERNELNSKLEQEEAKTNPYVVYANKLLRRADLKKR